MAPFAASDEGVLTCVGHPDNKAARYAYTPKLRTLALIVIELEKGGQETAGQSAQWKEKSFLV